jgi:hypothetical protein
MTDSSLENRGLIIFRNKNEEYLGMDCSSDSSIFAVSFEEFFNFNLTTSFVQKDINLFYSEKILNILPKLNIHFIELYNIKPKKNN